MRTRANPFAAFTIQITPLGEDIELTDPYFHSMTMLDGEVIYVGRTVYMTQAFYDRLPPDQQRHGVAIIEP